MFDTLDMLSQIELVNPTSCIVILDSLAILRKIVPILSKEWITLIPT